MTDPLNHVTTFRVTKRSLPWDITDANGKKILDRTYDDLEQLIEEDQTLNGNTLRTQYFYDGNGHLGVVENPNNVSWSKNYNTLDQLDTERDPASRFTTYEYDLNGNVSKRTDRKGQYLLYTYGSADRLEGIACYKIGSILESSVVLNYDPTTKLLTSVTDNEFGAQSWSWTYDSLDRITGASGPNGGVTYTLDNLGRRTGMTATGQSPITYGFSPIDQIASITHGSQSYTFTHDPLNRSKKSDVTFDSHLYTRDAVGQILQENKNGTLDVFGYDELYRLTSATVSGASYRWSYDNNGNRLTQDKGLAHTDYTCDRCDCLLSVNGAAVTSDANGSATAFVSDVYSWDVRNRLVKLTRPGLTIDLTYDPFGNRTSKKVNGTLTKFLLDGDSVVSEVTGTTTVSTLQGPTLDQPLARNGRYFAPNELGSTSKLTDAVGGVVQSYDYSPFGETTQSTGESNPFQYAGRENDGTGLY